MSDKNKATIRTIREQAVGRSGSDLDVLNGLYSGGYRYHGGAFGELEGADAFKNLLEGMSGVLEGYREKVVDQVAEGSTVVTRIAGRGRALADLPGIAANSDFEMSAVSFAVFDADGRVAEEWVYTVPAG